MKINAYAKAIVGSVIAGLGSLQLALMDAVISGAEWVTVASVTLAAFALVWAVPNASTPEPVVVNNTYNTPPVA